MERRTRCFEVSIPPSFPVVLCIFLMACSQVGTIKSMGVYLEDISLSLGTTSTDIGVALGLFTAFSYFPAPLIVSLYRLRSIRRAILISGSSLISLGVILTAFATSNILIAVYLTIAGFGHCTLTISSVVALDQLSRTKNFNILFGVGMSGFGVGMILLPFVADFLGRVYGWRGGLLLLGGLMANLVPCAMSIQVEPSNIDDSQESGPSEEVCRNHCPSKEGDTTKNTHCSDLPYQPDKQFGEDYPLMNSTAVDQILREPQKEEKSFQRILDRLRARFYRSDFYLDPVLSFIFVPTFVYGVLYCGWHAFLVPHAIQRGYSIRSTIIMTLFASVGNFLGRLLAGALSGRLSNPIILYLGAALLNAFAILCDAFLHNYYIMSVTACLSAVSIAAMSLLGPLAIKERASSEYFDVAYAADEVFFGLGTLLGGYLSGLVGDVFLTYNATFILLAGVDILVFLLMLPPLLLKKPTNL